MITGTENTLNVNNILSKISEYDIYRYYLGYDFHLKKLMKSPFRKENNGSFNIFYTKNGSLRHKDFGDGISGNCFNFVQQLYNIDFGEALRKISYDFNLGLGPVKSNSGVNYGTITSCFDKPEEDYYRSQKTTIHVQNRRFTKGELEYWNIYGLEESDLVKNNVYSIEKLYINGKLITNWKKELRFAYMFEFNGEFYFKIYQPYSENYKWISNVPIKQAMGFEKLPLHSNNIIIAKSKKDKMIIEKIHSDIYEVQKEGPECIPDELDSFFDEYYDNKFCFYDNDIPGMKASIIMNRKGYKWINIPNEYKALGIKDPGELLEHFGVEEGMRILELVIKRKLNNES